MVSRRRLDLYIPRFPHNASLIRLYVTGYTAAWDRRHGNEIAEGKIWLDNPSKKKR